MIARPSLLALVILLVATSFCEAASLSAFPYRKSLRIIESEGDGIGRFELDEEVLAQAAEGYGNLRLVNKNGRQTPFAVFVRRHDLRTYPREAFETKEGNRRTVVNFEARNVPLCEITISTPDRDFLRSITVEASDSRDDIPGWRRLAHDTISVIGDGKAARERLTVLLPKVESHSKYRIVIENQDSPPLRIDDIELKGPTIDVVFLSGAGGEFQLFYGGHAGAPKYDLEKVLSTGPQRKNDSFALDWQEDNPDYSPLRAAGGSLGRKVMIAAMIMALLTLGWLVAVSVRKVDSLTPQ